MVHKYKKMTFGIVLGPIFLFLLSSCEPVNRYLGLKDDNLGEEVIEGLIESQIHVPVDLTPSSPE